MSEAKNNISAVRLGDKLIIFVDGQRQVISKSMSPEIFDRVCGYIERGEVNKISDIFDNFEDKLSKYLQDHFELEEGKLKDNFHNSPNHFSKLLIRKGTELMSENAETKPLFLLSKKIMFTSDLNDNGLFDSLSYIGLTKNGNLLLPLKNDEVEVSDKVFGSPICITKDNETHLKRSPKHNTISIELASNKPKDEFLIYALINPFDIVSFGKSNINVSRYKAYKKGDLNLENGITDIENERLFDISYNIYENKFKNK